MSRKCISRLLLVFLLAGLVLGVYAGGRTLTLDSAGPVQEQIAAFTTWYLSLPDAERREWQLALNTLSEPGIELAAFSSAGETLERMVWVSRTGSKYHSKSTCSNMRNASQVTLEAALNRGLEPCSKCW